MDRMRSEIPPDLTMTKIMGRENVSRDKHKSAGELREATARPATTLVRRRTVAQEASIPEVHAQLFPEEKIAQGRAAPGRRSARAHNIDDVPALTEARF